MKHQVITYSRVGDDYDTKDPVKKFAQKAARQTSSNLAHLGFGEISDSRGESAFVWQQGDTLMASVVEGLGTKNLVADQMREITGKSYYDVIGHDTVATIINDLISVGATPLVVQAYWAVEDNSWLADTKRLKDLVTGWRAACDEAGATWGGGETPTLKDIIEANSIDLGGAAVGIIKDKKRLIIDKNLKGGERILLLGSSGINANGLSLARAIAKNLPQGYATQIAPGLSYGEAILTKSNIYARLLERLFRVGIDIRYISHITGHGLRKLMRARSDFTYVIEKIFRPQPLFAFIKKHAKLSDYEMYQTYNMGSDYALFIPEANVRRALQVIRECGVTALDAGYVKGGKRQVVIEPLNITYPGNTLNLR